MVCPITYGDHKYPDMWIRSSDMPCWSNVSVRTPISIQLSVNKTDISSIFEHKPPLMFVENTTGNLNCLGRFRWDPNEISRLVRDVVVRIITRVTAVRIGNTITADRASVFSAYNTECCTIFL